MARPSKLTEAQCAQIRALKNDPDNPVSAPVLAKRFKVSESSIYKVLDGSYVARPDEAPAIATAPHVVPGKASSNCPAPALPQVPPVRPLGATPSIFHGGDALSAGTTAPHWEAEGPRRRASDYAPRLAPTLGELLERVAQADHDEPINEVALAAAELVIAKARFSQVLAATH